MPDTKQTASTPLEENPAFIKAVKQEVQEVITKRIESDNAATLDPSLDPANPAFTEESYEEAIQKASGRMTIAIIKATFAFNGETKPTQIKAGESITEEIHATIAESMRTLRQAEKAAAYLLKDRSPAFIEAVAALDPYLRIELESYKEIYQHDEDFTPNISDWTIQDVYDKGFTATGEPIPDSIIAEVIELAIKRKKDYAGDEIGIETFIVARRLAKQKDKFINITVTHTDKIDYPLDKVNTEVWDILTNTTFNEQLQLDTITIDVSRGSKKREAAIIYGITFDILEEEATELKITKHLTQYDKRVYISVAALYNAGNEYITATQIYKQMGNTSRPNARQLQKIHDSILKMGRARIYIDNLHEATNRKYKKFELQSIDTPLLSFSKVDGVVINGKEVGTVYHIFTDPQFTELPLMEFARKRKQITTYKLELLQSPANKTEDNLLIEDYLLDRIAHMKNGNEHPKLTYKTIYERCKINTKVKRQRAPEKIKGYLDHYKKHQFIYDYAEESNGIYIYVSEDAYKKKNP